jgi:aspartate carbamoyltransferase catalytic subunit
VKGETLRDTARNLEAMNPDFIVIRHGMPGAPHFLSRVLGKPSIVNAGDGSHEHPTQALLDAFTIRQKKKRIAGLRVLIVGDILHSRVVRSNIFLLRKLGAKVTVAGPATLIPPGMDVLDVDVSHDLDRAVEGADVVMMLRIQMERQGKGYFPSVREYFHLFGLTPERVARAAPDVIIMHPGPINRGVEISSDVADGPYSVILDQVTNGIAVRMAVLYLLAGGAPAPAA